jgi:uncharacterized protein YndB with AHSA1/START domain
MTTVIETIQDSRFIALVVQRTIRATPEFLFDAWTKPEMLVKWWGPEHVTCAGAEIDLHVGGRYRIANRFPDGAIVWISGEFEIIERPHRVVFTWQIDTASAAERVTVRFDPRDGVTQVVVCHERITSETARHGHEKGWEGCLDGLAAFAEP